MHIHFQLLHLVYVLHNNCKLESEAAGSPGGGYIYTDLALYDAIIEKVPCAQFRKKNGLGVSEMGCRRNCINHSSWMDFRTRSITS